MERPEIKRRDAIIGVACLIVLLVAMVIAFWLASRSSSNEKDGAATPKAAIMPASWLGSKSA